MASLGIIKTVAGIFIRVFIFTPLSPLINDNFPTKLMRCGKQYFMSYQAKTKRLNTENPLTWFRNISFHLHPFVGGNSVLGFAGIV